MSALLKMEMYEAVNEAASLNRSTAWLPEVIVSTRVAPAAPVAAEAVSKSALENIALFLISPFIGLAYIMAMPFVAAGMLAWFGAKALLAKAAQLPESVKKAGLVIAAPFLGLGFILALPAVGVTALGYFALKASARA